MTPAALADLKMAAATLEYVFAVADITHFAAKATSGPIEDALESPRMLALVGF